MKEQCVVFYVMRHGQKDPDSGPNDLALLSLVGREQVRKSAEKNLGGLDFDRLYCSMKFRTLETVTIVASLLPKRNNGLGVETRWAFDYSGAPDLGSFPQDEKAIGEIAARESRRVTIADWENISPRMVVFLRERLKQELGQIACQLTEDSGRDIHTVFVASHTVAGELACLDPEAMYPLREADLVRYVVTVSRWQGEEVVRIIASDYLERGF